jgi:hypothetical protein
MLLFFIAAVSVHDAALVVVNQNLILDVEQNPVGRWLIEANGGSIWPFVAIKLLGTSAACAVVLDLHQRCRPTGLLVAAGVAAFQAGLLLYLSTG